MKPVSILALLLLSLACRRQEELLTVVPSRTITTGIDTFILADDREGKTVFLSGDAYGISAYDYGSGARLWTRTLDWNPGYAVLLDSGRYLAVSCTMGDLWLVDAASGKVLEGPVPTKSRMAPGIPGGLVINMLPLDDTRFVLCNFYDSLETWTVANGKLSPDVLETVSTLGISSIDDMAVGHGKITTLGRDDSVAVLTFNGKEFEVMQAVRPELGDLLWCAPSASGIIVGNTDGAVYSIDQQGEAKKTARLDYDRFVYMENSDVLIAVRSGDRLHLLDASSGKLVAQWRAPLGHVDSTSPLSRDEVLIGFGRMRGSVVLAKLE